MVGRRPNPEVYKAFAFGVTRITDFRIGCYHAEPGGYVRPHRDNIAPQLAYRRFALSPQLNGTDVYGGGGMRSCSVAPVSMRSWT